jgi:hypothetical protein
MKDYDYNNQKYFGEDNSYKIIFKLHNGQYVIDNEQDICTIEQKHKIDLAPNYIKNGNLQTFMEWFNEQRTKSEIIHVVTHSGIMSKYFKQDKFGQIDLKKKVEDGEVDTYKNIRNTNLWSFNTTETNENVPFTQPGIAMDKSKGIIDNDNSDYSSCGNQGRVDDVQCLLVNNNTRAGGKSKSRKRKSIFKSKSKKSRKNVKTKKNIRFTKNK